MPPIQRRDCKLDALFWPVAGHGDDGLPYVLTGSAEPIKVRWQQQLRTGTDPRGNTITTTVTIAADRVVDGVRVRLPLDSFLWLGTADELPGTASEPLPSADVWQVVTESHAPDVRGRSKRYEYGLMRRGDALPVRYG